MYTKENMSMREIGKIYDTDGSPIKKVLVENNIEIDQRGKRKNKYIIDEENKTANIELRRRNKESLWTTIDLEDLERVLNFPYSWCSGYRKNTDSWYARSTIHKLENVDHDSHGIYLNYFIAGVNSKSGYCVDHENHNTLDNRKSNLRVTETLYNTKHRKGKNSNNVSGYRNVAYMKRDNNHPYWVQIMIDGKNTVMGKFSDVHEAGIFAEEMRHKYYKDFAGES